MSGRRLESHSSKKQTGKVATAELHSDSRVMDLQKREREDWKERKSYEEWMKVEKRGMYGVEESSQASDGGS